MPGNAGPRPAHRPSRRDAIVAAAVRVFAERGPQASMGAIARECGLGPTALYYHFAGKDELFTAAVDTVAEQVQAATAQAEREARTDALPMHEAAETVWRWAAAHRGEARLLYSWTESGPPAARAVRARFVQRYRDKILERIPGRPRAEPTADLVDRLAARTYMRLAVHLSEDWVTGRGDEDPIVAALSTVGRRHTGAP